MEKRRRGKRSGLALQINGTEEERRSSHKTSMSHLVFQWTVVVSVRPNPICLFQRVIISLPDKGHSLPNPPQPSPTPCWLLPAPLLLLSESFAEPDSEMRG